MKKRSMMLATSMMLVVLLIAGGTFAWFSFSTEMETNTFTAGTLEIELFDEFDEDEAANINPGQCIEKEVYVCNTGTKKAVVRIQKDLVITAREGHSLPTNVVDWNLGDDWFEMTYNGVNYFVYNKVLEAGCENNMDAALNCCPPCPPDEPECCTTPLFKDNKVCFKGPEMDNRYQGATFDMNIMAEGFQATYDAPAEWGLEADVDTVNGAVTIK